MAPNLVVITHFLRSPFGHCIPPRYRKFILSNIISFPSRTSSSFCSILRTRLLPPPGTREVFPSIRVSPFLQPSLHGVRSCAPILCSFLADISYHHFFSFLLRYIFFCAIQFEVHCFYWSPLSILHMFQSRSLCSRWNSSIPSTPSSFHESYLCLFYPSEFAT